MRSASRLIGVCGVWSLSQLSLGRRRLSGVSCRRMALPSHTKVSARPIERPFC